MGIVDDDVVRVREGTDIVAVISEHLQLRRVGRRWVGLCPFHQENSPSFSVNQELGVYHCFGCQRSGDAITFVREVEGLDFVGAVERLATKAAIALRYTNRDEGEGRRKRTRLVEAVAAAVAFYHQRLLTGDDAGVARRYLRERGITGEEARRFQIGWAPDDWDALARGIDVKTPVLVDAGLGFVNRRGRAQDTFRARILFPIYDLQGEPVGFGGRKLPGAEGPKYKNSPESAIYAKSRLLYGLNWAKEPVVQADEAIVCEGYTDVIGFARAGLPRAVATCGTALTEEHVRVLKRFAKRLVLAFDADGAGQAAAERVYEWERSHDIDVAVAALPSGVDPADLAQTDPAALERAIADAQPFLAFRVDRVLAAADMRTAEGRARAAERALDLIAAHPNQLVRDQYLMDVAQRCQLEIGTLREMSAPDYRRQRSGSSVETLPGRSPARVGAGGVGSNSDRAERPSRLVLAPRDSVERQMLRLAVQSPELVAPFVTEDLFADELNREAFATLAGAAELHRALAVAAPEVGELLQRLAVEEVDVSDERGAERLAGRLVDEAAGRELRRLEAEVRSTGNLEVGRRIADLMNTLAELRDRGWRMADAERLLTWLVEGAERS